MAYDEGLAHRIRAVLASQPNVYERKMFGGLAFMVNGNMCCGVMGDQLMVRVGAEQWPTAVALPHARAMDFTGKPMTGMVYVDQGGLAEDEDLAVWIGRGLAFVATLPPK